MIINNKKNVAKIYIYINIIKWFVSVKQQEALGLLFFIMFYYYIIIMCVSIM